MRFRCFSLFPLILTALLIFSCAAKERKGEQTYVPGAGGLPGYTIYVRDAESPKFSVFESNKSNEIREFPLQKPEEGDKIDKASKASKANKRIKSLSPLYYYRSPNPNRLTRIRLRRF
jgi:hypothetical protein